MKKVVITLLVVLLLLLTAMPIFAHTNQTDACWGQASAVYARMGLMGEHSSSDELPLPRAGLANLARELYESGDIAEPTLQALGAFVATALGLSIDACM